MEDIMKLTYGYTQPIHDLAEKYITKEILCLDSTFVEAALDLQNEMTNDFTKAFSFDNVENLYYISPDWIADNLSPEQIAAFNKAGFTSPDDLETLFDNSLAGLNQEEIALLSQALHQWTYKDSETHIIYEWYRVTNWLASKLIQNGQPVLANDYGYWWGRTCTGQAIILDGTIREIAKNYV